MGSDEKIHTSTLSPRAHARAVWLTIFLAASSIAYTVAAILSIVALSSGDLISCLCDDPLCSANLADRGLVFDADHVALVCTHQAFYRVMLYLGMAFALAAAGVSFAVIRGAAALLAMPWMAEVGVLALIQTPGGSVMEEPVAAWPVRESATTRLVYTREEEVEAAAPAGAAPVPATAPPHAG